MLTLQSLHAARNMVFDNRRIVFKDGQVLDDSLEFTAKEGGGIGCQTKKGTTLGSAVLVWCFLWDWGTRLVAFKGLAGDTELQPKHPEIRWIDLMQPDGTPRPDVEVWMESDVRDIICPTTGKACGCRQKSLVVACNCQKK